MERKPRILTALRAQSDFDLVLCGVFFDETRAFDLLRFVRQEFPALPFVACRIGDRAVAPVMAEAFIDMPLLHADHATDLDFRSQVLRHIR